jgi:chromosomal replication initiator protein
LRRARLCAPRYSGSKAGAALGPTRPDHRTTAPRFHAHTKPMRALAARLGWLIGTFHGRPAFSDVKKLGITTPRIASCQIALLWTRSEELLWITRTEKVKIGGDFQLSAIGRTITSLSPQMNSFWRYCLSHFEKELPAQQFQTWIRPLKFNADGSVLTLIAPNRFVLQWIRDKFLERIQALAAGHFDHPVEVRLLLADKAPTGGTATALPVEASPTSPRVSNRDISRLNPAFTFETFVTGKANELARAAATQVAERPGTAYNPLFVYGGVGLGKTHLIQAIGNALHARAPESKIRYIHAEQYVSDVVRAYQHKAFDDFKRYYHSLDLLLIDDIQFFSGKSRTQEEFFYAFNALIESHKQVVITCDTYPKEISGIENRLISRFGWGLTVAVEPPELEMRVAILLKKAEAEALVLDEPVAFFLAKHIQSNVRELEGGLKRVLAYARFSAQEISVDLCRDALRDLLAIQSRQVSIENIQKTVADYYKIKVSEMYSKKRSRNVARPRQIAMALAKELTHMSLPDIGEAFGGRDHTTVLHACRKVASLRNTNTDVTRDIASLLKVLRS